MDKALLELIKISNAVGRDSSLIQGGGGNTSVKTEDGKYMYIKASGTALKDMNRHRGWRRLRLQDALSIIKDKSIAKLDTYNREAEVVRRLLNCCDDEIAGDSRPSVETHLHSFLDKCVIHLHPVAVLAYACAKNGKAELEKLFKDEKPPPLWVPYRDPGFMLGSKIIQLVGRYQKRFGRKPAIVFLQKHGLLVSAKSPDAALQLLNKVIKRCSAKLKRPTATGIAPVSKKIIADTALRIGRAVFEATGQNAGVSYFCDEVITAFCRLPAAAKMLKPMALTPDEQLYAGGPAMWVDERNFGKIADRLGRQIKKGERPSAAFLVKGVGLFVVAGKKLAAVVRDITENSFIIRTSARRFGGVVTLNKKGRDFINHWEPDAFRKKLAGG